VVLNGASQEGHTDEDGKALCVKRAGVYVCEGKGKNEGGGESATEGNEIMNVRQRKHGTQWDECDHIYDTTITKRDITQFIIPFYQLINVIH